MPAGLIVYNSSGYVQLDETYVAYKEIQSGVGTSDVDVTFPPQTVPPLIIISPTTINVPHWVSTTSNGLRTGSFRCVTSDGGNFGYKVLVPSSATGASTVGAGLRVYDANGSLAFDSGAPIFRVRAVYTVYPNTSSWSQTFSLPSDVGTYGFTFSSTRLFAVVPANFYEWYVLAVEKNNEATFTARIYHSLTGPQIDYNSVGLPSTIIFGTYV